MRLLDRYLLREFLIPFGYCLCGFLILWIAFDLFSELHSLIETRRLLAGDIIEYYIFKTPEFLILVLPVSLLLALLYTLTNHARHNEITAIRAAGVSLWRLCLPYIGIGFLASVGLFATNEFLAPRCADIADQIRLRRTLTGSAGEQATRVKLGFTSSREGQGERKWEVPVYNTKTYEMVSPVVIWTSTNGSSFLLSAERAVWTNDEWMFLGKVNLHEESTLLLPIKTNRLAMPEFSETPKQIQSEIDISERWNPNMHNFREADIPLWELINYLHLHPHPQPLQLRNWLWTKLHGRLAGPWACLLVVIIAVPFAAASGRRNAFVGVAASILICFIYFIVQQFGFAFGSAGWLPAWVAAWLPNLLFGIAGLWMMARMR